MVSASSLFADLRYGFRQLRLNPGFAFIAIVTLTLGIGANTALFSVVRSVILKPLPYHEPERIVRVWMDNRRLQMREALAQINDMNPVAGVEDEPLHLRIPTPGLVSEMDARFQQFFYANANHNFPLVKSPPRSACEPSRGTRD